MNSILLVISALIAVNCSPILESENSDDFFVDQVLNATKFKYMTELEPYSIGDFGMDFHIETEDKNYTGKFYCTHTYATGLSYVNRYEASSKGSKDDTFVTHLQFGDDNLKLHSQAHVEFQDLSPNVSVVAEISDLKIDVTVGKDDDGNAKVMDVMTHDITKFVLHFIGPFGQFDPLVNTLEDKMIKAGNPIVKDNAHKMVSEVFGKVFNQYKYPKN